MALNIKLHHTIDPPITREHPIKNRLGCVGPQLYHVVDERSGLYIPDLMAQYATMLGAILSGEDRKQQWAFWKESTQKHTVSMQWIQWQLESIRFANYAAGSNYQFPRASKIMNQTLCLDLEGADWTIGKENPPDVWSSTDNAKKRHIGQKRLEEEARKVLASEGYAMHFSRAALTALQHWDISKLLTEDVHEDVHDSVLNGFSVRQPWSRQWNEAYDDNETHSQEEMVDAPAWTHPGASKDAVKAGYHQFITGHGPLIRNAYRGNDMSDAKDRCRLPKSLEIYRNRQHKFQMRLSWGRRVAEHSMHHCGKKIGKKKSRSRRRQTKGQEANEGGGGINATESKR